MIILDIQLISKPEMTAQEATDYISDNFPQDEGDEFIISCDPKEGIVHLKISQDALTDAQQEWLHSSIFGARYVDGYSVTGQTQKEPTMPYEFSQPELIMLDLGITERRDRLRFALLTHDPSGEYAKSIKRLLETDLERLEALHAKLSGMIEGAKV